MSESGTVIILLVKPEPGPGVPVCTRLVPIIRSLGLVVVTAPLEADALLPEAAAVTSRGFVVSIPLYSRIRMSGYTAPTLNLTVTVLAPAVAEAIFFA